MLSLAWPAHASPEAKRLPLPAVARVTIVRKTLDPSSPYFESCKRFTATNQSIRHKFATYRDITGNDWHFLYKTDDPCFIHGTIDLGGKTFTWADNPDGWLGTTYPDGVYKELGSSNPKYIDNTH